MANNNEELINNTLKAINTLATIISLKEQSKIANNFKELNKINTVKREQLSTDNTLREQSNTYNTLREQSSIDNTSREQLDNESTYVKLSKWLKNLRCIINPLNNSKENNKCFQYSIALSKHKEMGVNYNRINKIEPFLRNFNFENIKYPLKK